MPKLTVIIQYPIICGCKKLQQEANFSWIYLFLVPNWSEIHLRQLSTAVSDVKYSVTTSNRCNPVRRRFGHRIDWQREWHIVADHHPQFTTRLQIQCTNKPAFSSHFPNKPGLARCLLDFLPSPSQKRICGAALSSINNVKAVTPTWKQTTSIQGQNLTLDLWPWPVVMSHMHTKDEGQRSLGSKVRVETNRWVDGQTYGVDYITCLTNTVGNQ